MTVQYIDVTVKVTKEASEIFVAIEKVIADIRDGKAPGEIALGNLQGLRTAVDGYDKLGDEVKDPAVQDTAALGAAKITKILLSKKAAV